MGKGIEPRYALTGSLWAIAVAPRLCFAAVFAYYRHAYRNGRCDGDETEHRHLMRLSCVAPAQSAVLANDLYETVERPGAPPSK